jgi:hypothetical protein
VDREERREANRLKNERRRERKKRNTLYAQEGRDERRRVGGAFGATDAATFNKLAEGTSAQRRAETEIKL